MQRTFTTGQIAKHFGVDLWQVLYALRRGRLPKPVRVGIYWIFVEADLPAIEAGLRKAGYLDREAARAK
jgi:hypothetical protein